MARPSSSDRSHVPAGQRYKTPNALWAAMKRLGTSPARVLAHAGLPPTLFDGRRNAVTMLEYFAIWEALSRLVPSPIAGVELVRAIDGRSLPPSNVAASCARTLREALGYMARHKRLCTPEEMRIEEVAAEAAITFSWPTGLRPPDAVVDASFASVLELGRSGTGRRLRPLRVQLRRKRRVSAFDEYCGVRATLGAARDTLVLAVVDLDEPFVSYNEELLEILRPGLERALREHGVEESTSAQVKRVLKRFLVGGRPSMGVLAKELGVSTRTLQRRILAEGTSIRRLTQLVRQELVRDYLHEANLELAEVAFLLGYEDANSFLRAFRLWEGQTPTRWRTTHAAQTRNGRRPTHRS